MTATKTAAKRTSMRDALRGLKRPPSTAAEPTVVDRILRRQRPPSKLRPVHLLPRIPLFAGLAPTTYAFEPPRHDGETAGLAQRPKLVPRPGRTVVTGWQEAQARLERLGLWVRITPKGRAYLVSQKGRAPVMAVETFASVASWIAAGLRGEPWPCDWCDKEAVALLAGGAPCCADHG